jgi:hypothetical protein
MSGLPGVRWLRRRSNARGMKQWAKGRGLSYQLRDDEMLSRYPEAFELDEGSHHRLVDVVSGPYRGHEVFCCTHRFRGDDGREDVGVYSIALPHTVPSLRVRRRDRPALGMAPRDFSEAYETVTADAAFGEAVLVPSVRSWLLESDAPGFLVGKDRIFVRSRSQLDVPRLAYWLDYLETIVARVPAGAWER